MNIFRIKYSTDYPIDQSSNLMKNNFALLKQLYQVMHNENDRPDQEIGFYSWKNIQVFISTIPNTGSKGVCLCVHVCVCV